MIIYGGEFIKNSGIPNFVIQSYIYTEKFYRLAISKPIPLFRSCEVSKAISYSGLKFSFGNDPNFLVSTNHTSCLQSRLASCHSAYNPRLYI